MPISARNKAKKERLRTADNLKLLGAHLPDGNPS